MSAQDALDFVSGLWSGGLPPGHFLTLWHRPARRSEWYTDVFELAEDAERLAEQSDVYIGGATVASGPPPATQRITQRALYTSGKRAGQPGNPAAAVHGVWLDLDYDHPKHKKPGLPPKEEVQRLVSRGGPLSPTYVVHSGHGFQLWWAFEQPWLLDTDEARIEAEGIMAAIRDHLSADLGGATIDSTHDVSRIMRLPGTLNHGDPADVVPVQLMDITGPRFTPEDLQHLFAPQALRGSGAPPPRGTDDPSGLTSGEGKPASSGGAPESRKRRPPLDTTGGTFPEGKHDALLANHDVYAQLWRHERQLADQSLSGYDMGLVRVAANAGWSDAELEALIIRHRSEHGDPQDKRVRRDYMDRTIRRARTDAGTFAAAGDAASAGGAGDDLLSDLNERAGGRVCVRLHTGDTPEFWVEIDGVEPVRIGDTMDFGPVAKAVYAAGAAVGRPIVLDPLRKTWPAYKAALVRVTRVVTVEEAHMRSRAELWIPAYLDSRGVQDAVNADRVETGLPLRVDQYIAIRLDDLYSWLRDGGERYSKRDVGDHLTVAGWKRYPQHYQKRDGTDGVRSYYRREEA